MCVGKAWPHECYDIGPGLSPAEATEQIAHAAEFLKLGERLLGPAEAGLRA